jgi:hypothetical protein
VINTPTAETQVTIDRLSAEDYRLLEIFVDGGLTSRAGHGRPAVAAAEGTSEAQGCPARLARWLADGNGDTFQVEALPPDRLIEIVEAAVLEHADLKV